MGKIRVICSDPYATDCSSDDDDSIETKRPANRKCFVQEISVFYPPIDHLRLDAPDSSSREDQPAKDVPICINEETDSTFAENNRSSEKERHLGVKKSSSGKWEVEIYHPIEGTTVNLGSHNTFEQATNAYEEKNLELTLLSNLMKLKKPDVQSKKAKRRLQKFELHNLNISETPTGKWGACYKNPITKLKVWMGIYATPEEAVISYCKKKADFDSSSNPKKLEKKGKTSSPSQDISEIASLNRPGISRSKTGRYGVIVYHPVTKNRHWMGYYDTAEEATEAFDKKKAELEGKVVNQKHTSSGKKKVNDYVKVANVPYKGVRLRESGRWTAEIKDPIKRKKTHIGTFDTPEEASDAYSKRKRELGEMVERSKKKKRGGKNASPGVVLEGDTSTVTAINSQNSEESHKNNSNDKQIQDEFGCSVINSYGQLIGEYSRIDEELWLTGPGDDDECVVDGAIGGTEDLGLDHKLFSCH